MSTHPNLPSTFINTLLRYLDERQLGDAALLQRLQALQGQNRVDHREFVAQLAHIATLDPQPALGLRIGLMAEPQDFGVVGYLVTACATLGQALTRYGRFQPLVLTGLKTRVIVRDHIAAHTWHIGDMGSAHACEFSVAVFVRLYQSLIAKAQAPARVGLPIPPPAYPAIHEAMLGCPVDFDAPGLCVDIPTTLLTMKISSGDPYLRKIFDQQAEAMLAQTRQTAEGFETFMDMLQQELLIAIKDGNTSAELVAQKLGYSLRSFYRKLSESGYSYRGILADLRRRLAKKYLADPKLSPSDVAMLLGYSEQSAFIRAFKDWTGMTPGDFRASFKHPNP